MPTPSVKILKCPRLSPKEFSKYKKEKRNLFANFALTTPVLNVTGMMSMVRKEFYTGCNLWINQKCAGITKAEYQNIGNNKEIPGYCTPCKINMFPFYGLKLVSTIFK